MHVHVRMRMHVRVRMLRGHGPACMCVHVSAHMCEVSLVCGVHGVWFCVVLCVLWLVVLVDAYDASNCLM